MDNHDIAIEMMLDDEVAGELGLPGRTSEAQFRRLASGYSALLAVNNKTDKLHDGNCKCANCKKHRDTLRGTMNELNTVIREQAEEIMELKESLRSIVDMCEAGFEEDLYPMGCIDRAKKALEMKSDG